MIIDEQDYIQHFGKKGMQWGVRKARNVPVNLKNVKEKAVVKVKENKIEITANMSGAAYTAYKISRHKNESLSNLVELAIKNRNPYYKKARNVTRDILNVAGETPISKIKRR